MIRIDLVSRGRYSAEAIPSLLRRIHLKGGRDETLRQFEELCLHLHTLAAASLLVEGDTRAFRGELRNAAVQWLRLLQHQHARQWVSPPASRNKVLLGTILAGHWDLAYPLAKLSAIQWQEGVEYEDDACWALVLQELVLTRSSGITRIEALLLRLEALGGELNGHRTSWVRRLLAANASGLTDAFSALLFLHQEDIERQVRALTASEMKLAPYRFLWFEGLALLQLGERRGVTVSNGYYRYCPFLARCSSENTGHSPG